LPFLLCPVERVHESRRIRASLDRRCSRLRAPLRTDPIRDLLGFLVLPLGPVLAHGYGFSLFSRASQSRAWDSKATAADSRAANVHHGKVVAVAI
jgi:hypothetical protein